ncbi:MAG: tetratricopeptide repeat protein [Gammaproteobacteria bacterium]|nr:tetratricopeptide repeat protein [Gammaproteobacteria bacterium]
MKKLIFYFLLILGAVWLGSTIYAHPGYIIVLYKQWAIETSTWFLVLTFLLVFFLLHLLLNLLRNTVHLPSRIEHWWHKYQDRKGIKRLNKGYVELLRGKWTKAETYLLKSTKNKGLSFVSYALAAQAADEQHSAEKRDRYLLQAKQKDQKNGYVADIIRAQFLLKNNYPEQALTLLLNIKEQHSKDPYLLMLQAESYLQLKDWSHLQLLLKELKKNKVFAPEKYLEIEKQAYLHSLQDQYFVEFPQVQLLWNRMPKYLRHDTDVIIAYANQLNRWNRTSEAEKLIRQELKTNFTGKLMEYYVTTRPEDPVKQLAIGEKYLKQHSEDAASLRAMGTLCLRNRLWGQARDYFEHSLRIQPVSKVYSSLGLVYEKLGENERALNYYRKGLNTV